MLTQQSEQRGRGTEYADCGRSNTTFSMRCCYRVSSTGTNTIKCFGIIRSCDSSACTSFIDSLDDPRVHALISDIFNCGAGVEVGASAAHGIIIPFVLIVVGFVRAVCRGAARTPFHDKRPAPAEKFSLGRQTFLMQLCASIRGK